VTKVHQMLLTRSAVKAVNPLRTDPADENDREVIRRFMNVDKRVNPKRKRGRGDPIMKTLKTSRALSVYQEVLTRAFYDFTQKKFAHSLRGPGY